MSDREDGVSSCSDSCSSSSKNLTNFSTETLATATVLCVSIGLTTVKVQYSMTQCRFNPEQISITRFVSRGVAKCNLLAFRDPVLLQCQPQRLLSDA